VNRPLHVAADDWKRISLELRVFNTPEVKVTETLARKTVVAKKWIFNSREVR
jgi:hypothetical protein